jgi:hypothetical protein
VRAVGGALGGDVAFDGQGKLGEVGVADDLVVKDHAISSGVITRIPHL